MTRERNARFWHWNSGAGEGSWVKLTLHPGQTLSHYTYSPHEEGYSAEGVTWELDRETVTRTIDTDGRDCDGSHGWHCAQVCHIDRLGAMPPYYDADAALGIMGPDWQDIDASQYDEFAEAAGY